MEEIKAVIGKNFGDEGKGKVVDILSRDAAARGKRALIIRHNGGAQAGHTVEGPGFRFVHHQLGSGTRQGADTCWSSTFLPDLLKLGEEIQQYQEAAAQAGLRPLPVRVYADGGCIFTTVYDVMLNQMAEELRGDMRHGSCGMGIYETVLRSGCPEYAFRLKDMRGKSAGEAAEMLRRIREGYVPGRMAEILRETNAQGPREQGHRGTGTWDPAREGEQETGTQDPREQGRRETGEPAMAARDACIGRWRKLLLDENLLYHAAEQMTENFRRYVILTEPAELVKRYPVVIFENAQGLLLDEDREDYGPHLTASHTGLANILAFLEKCTEEESELPLLELHYVTRTYVTRHGAGRLDCECPKEEIAPALVDRTNVPNPWQGGLRYGKHPGIKAFFEGICRDRELLEKYPKMRTRIFCAVSHLDETDGKVLFADGPRTMRELSGRAAEEMDISFEIAGRDSLVPPVFSEVKSGMPK